MKGARLFTDKARYKRGEIVHVWFENASTSPFVVHNPGGSSSCPGEPLSIGPIGGKSAAPHDVSKPAMCLEVIVPPSNTVIPAGAKYEVGQFDLRGVFLRESATPVPVGAGRYTITSSMPGSTAIGALSVSIEVE